MISGQKDRVHISKKKDFYHLKNSNVGVLVWNNLHYISHNCFYLSYREQRRLTCWCLTPLDIFLVQTIYVSLCKLYKKTKIKTNDNELKIYFVMGALNQNFNSRRSNSLSCCISHSIIIYNDFSPINQPLNQTKVR